MIFTGIWLGFTAPCWIAVTRSSTRYPDGLVCDHWFTGNGEGKFRQYLSGQLSLSGYSPQPRRFGGLMLRIGLLSSGKRPPLRAWGLSFESWCGLPACQPQLNVLDFSSNPAGWKPTYHGKQPIPARRDGPSNKSPAFSGQRPDASAFGWY